MQLARKRIFQCDCFLCCPFTWNYERASSSSICRFDWRCRKKVVKMPPFPRFLSIRKRFGPSFASDSVLHSQANSSRLFSFHECHFGVHNFKFDNNLLMNIMHSNGIDVSWSKRYRDMCMKNRRISIGCTLQYWIIKYFDISPLAVAECSYPHWIIDLSLHCAPKDSFWFQIENQKIFWYSRPCPKSMAKMSCTEGSREKKPPQRNNQIKIDITIWCVCWVCVHTKLMRWFKL